MKVLIVDDNHLLLTRLTIALKKNNANMIISHAVNCKEALELFPAFSPDNVILDISLPDGSGISLLQEFKKNDPAAKVIMFTNFPSAEFKKRCFELGADGFFEKSNIHGLMENIGLQYKISNKNLIV